MTKAKSKTQVVKPNGDIKQVENGVFVDDNVSDIAALKLAETAAPAEPAQLPGGYAERQAARAALRNDDGRDYAGEAAEQLGSFDLVPGAISLLQRSIDNTINNKGVGLTDPDARADAAARSALLEAADGDLTVAIACIVECSESKEIAGTVYSLLYNVLKSATFLANMDYRRALDPTADFDHTQYTPIISKGEDGQDRYDPDFRNFLIDRREDESPLEGNTGHQTRLEWQLEQMQELYGNGFMLMEDAVLRSLQDLQMFFQLTVESMGWDPNRPMPYAYEVDSTGPTLVFTPITSAEAAMDMQEIKRQVARGKKRDKANAMATTMAQMAQAKIAEALSRAKA